MYLIQKILNTIFTIIQFPKTRVRNQSNDEIEFEETNFLCS